MMKFRLGKRTTGRSIADLQADSGTVRYELDMLLETAKRYTDAEGRRDIVGRNMAVESFAVHCRGLILFLFGHLEGLDAKGEDNQKFNRDRDTDIFAWDYYPSWEFDCPAPSDEIYHAKKRADKHVAHVTTDRRGINQDGTGRESVWDMRAAVNEIGAAMALFVTKAPVHNFDAEEQRKMKARLAPWIAPAVTPPPSIPFIAKSGPLDDSLAAVNIHAKTDARTTAPPPAFYPYGTTE
jgi:hypothetical protein